MYIILVVISTPATFRETVTIITVNAPPPYV